MEIILTQDIKGVGYKNDLVTVKPGFGRNYLIPQGLAMVANATNKKVLAENLKQAAHKADKIKDDASAIASGVEDLLLEIKAKVGEKGKIFGAITTLQISDALKVRGFDVDRKKIGIKGEVKEEGEYQAVLDLHKEVQVDVTFKVVPE